MTSAMERKIKQLATERRWEILALLSDDSMSGIDMARRMGVYWKTFKSALEQMDLPEGIRIPQKGKRSYSNGGVKRSRGDIEKHEMIVGLREQGLTYQVIADMYGISRERVRQILAMNDADGGFCYVDPVPHTNCRECGREYHPKTRSRLNGFCSQKCAGAHKSHLGKDRWAARLERIAAIIYAGGSWHDVAQAEGYKSNVVANLSCFKACKKYGLPFPYTHKNGSAS